ncbi:hypothetical protein SCYAM73S_05117 [Streptomyces cyaneofuscatus]
MTGTAPLPICRRETLDAPPGGPVGRPGSRGGTLLVSEVVTNAVRYAERPVTLRLLRTDILRCEVGDDSPQLPRQRRARETDEGGRGLFLVNRLARRWGATRLSTGKVVWFEMATRS